MSPLVDDDQGAHSRYRLRIPGEGGRQARQGRGLKAVIVIQEEDVLASRLGQAPVPGGASFSVLRQADGADPWAAQRRQPFWGCVLGGIVDDQQLPVLVCLGQHAVDCKRQVFLPVMNGYDDGYSHRG